MVSRLVCTCFKQVPCFKPISQDRSFASSLILHIHLILSIYFSTTGYVLQLNINCFRHSPEYGRMHQPPSQALSSRLLLIPKSYAVRSRHLHPAAVNHSIPVDHLTLRSSANRTLTRRYLGVVTGVYQKRQIRRESTIDKAIGAEKQKQNKAPWHREGSDMPPVARQRSAGAMIKGSRTPLRASMLTDLRLRKAIDNPVSPPQAHHTSHHS